MVTKKERERYEKEMIEQELRIKEYWKYFEPVELDYSKTKWKQMSKTQKALYKRANSQKLDSEDQDLLKRLRKWIRSGKPQEDTFFKLREKHKEHIYDNLNKEYRNDKKLNDKWKLCQELLYGEDKD